MKKLIKISMLVALIVGFSANAEEITLVDYLNGEEVSFMVMKTGSHTRLTTYDWLSAVEGCKNIKNAGFSVNRVTNYEAETKVETTTDCKI